MERTLRIGFSLLSVGIGVGKGCSAGLVASRACWMTFSMAMRLLMNLSFGQAAS